mmetsp:Transcript_46978/g.93546  ORF Transcript_46978/g.93546 Transcript_46978/m.93546 type:complete len:151 (-) Transcript_46978:55-507(-)
MVSNHPVRKRAHVRRRRVAVGFLGRHKQFLRRGCAADLQCAVDEALAAALIDAADQHGIAYGQVDSFIRQVLAGALKQSRRQLLQCLSSADLLQCSSSSSSIDCDTRKKVRSALSCLRNPTQHGVVPESAAPAEAQLVPIVSGTQPQEWD